MKYANRAEPVRSLIDLQKWVRSRRVRLSVRFLKTKKVYEVVAKAESGKHHIRTLDTDLTIAMATTVDTMNDYIEGEGKPGEPGTPATRFGGDDTGTMGRPAIQQERGDGTMTSRVQFVALCEMRELNPINEESALLSIGLEFLPQCAADVLAGEDGSVEYWTWACRQVVDSRRP